ncbi:protein kinase interacting protein [Lonomia obliqua multiple nucleopolyhedrovirus]|uniref:Protein kinase interacting protein n=1 Tax=Lonomia obliqua multiple nucleopolyhedrovirus TaxID=134394 RepID=A0A126FCA5_9ABAC|nr:protein kinase interacting protein [Lonomia obliqua multiple nucleopolyhedrovirus]AKN81009.1 protein kinase interacting protein [Lonomia obliqua multiple nucleopolyhedrovirus]
MSTNLCFVVAKARQNLETLIHTQNKKTKSYFCCKNESSSNEEEKLLIVAAKIAGLVEQIEILNYTADLSKADKLDFVYDYQDLDLNKDEIIQLCETRNLSYFSTKYDAAAKLNKFPAAYDFLLKQTEFFIDAICELHAKQQNQTIEELIKIKSCAIKHLCSLEYLVNIKS